jgi:hypothetical protein
MRSFAKSDSLGMQKLLIAALFACLSIPALAMSKAERQAFLDAVRPSAEKKVGQAVRFKVDRLNVDSGWAVMVGELLPEVGRKIDWDKVEGCEADLDKMLWVVAKKEAQGWQVKKMEICASEPPYWYLDKADYQRPCGIYAGLEVSGDRTAEQDCRAYQRRQGSSGH